MKLLLALIVVYEILISFDFSALNYPLTGAKFKNVKSVRLLTNRISFEPSKFFKSIFDVCGAAL